MMNPFNAFSISPDYSQANALALARVSKLAYEPKGIIERIAWSWKLDFQYYDQDDTQAIILENQDFLILAFRGTEVDPDDILTDLDFWKVSGPLGGKVHRGFRSALDDIWELPDGPWHHIDNMMRSREKKPIFITGHSLGAALATLASAALCEFSYFPQGVYTFGCPRVGDWRFARALNHQIGHRFWRVENNNDIIPRLPPWFFGFRHAGQRVYLSTWGDIIHQPSWWYILRDRLRGRWRAISEPLTDGISDHGSMEYIKGLMIDS